jgi:hypothetical protein
MISSSVQDAERPSSSACARRSRAARARCRHGAGAAASGSAGRAAPLVERQDAGAPRGDAGVLEPVLPERPIEQVPLGADVQRHREVRLQVGPARVRREHGGGEDPVRARILDAEEVRAGRDPLRHLLVETSVERGQVLAEERGDPLLQAARVLVLVRLEEEAVGLDERAQRVRRHLVGADARAHGREGTEQLAHADVRGVEVVVRVAVEGEQEAALGVHVAARPEHAQHLVGGDPGLAQMLDDGEREDEVEAVGEEGEGVRVSDHVHVRRQGDVHADQVRPARLHVPRADLEDDRVRRQRFHGMARDPWVVAVASRQRRVERERVGVLRQEDGHALYDRVGAAALRAAEAVAARADGAAARGAGEEVPEPAARRPVSRGRRGAGPRAVRHRGRECLSSR